MLALTLVPCCLVTSVTSEFIALLPTQPLPQKIIVSKYFLSLELDGPGLALAEVPADTILAILECSHGSFCKHEKKSQVVSIGWGYYHKTLQTGRESSFQTRVWNPKIKTPGDLVPGKGLSLGS